LKVDENEKRYVASQDPDEVSQFLYDVETEAFGVPTEEFLPSGRTGTTIRYTSASSGLDVVSKKADLWKGPKLKDELLNEVAAFDKMIHLQGSVVPELKGYGVDPRFDWMYTLTTSHAGVPVSALGALFEDEKQQAIQALEAVHAAGVAHGDIRPENIVIERVVESQPGTVKWIDFAVAATPDSGPDVLGRNFEERVEAEREQLAQLLKELPTAGVGESSSPGRWTATSDDLC
jgi:hypothetical protein